ncbi:MAG TPA: hypothetical protein VFZ23_15420 [Pyrinomonadaceae bacterium]
MTDLEHLTSDLPDAESARRFLASLDEQHPRDAAKLRKNDGLLSDALTLASYSPLLATTLLQNPDYLWWLNRKRRAPAVRTKDELLEALGRFVLTHSQLDLHTQLARFRRRELLRIFLSDVRRLATMAEITEDISNLADAVLETALRSARQEIDNRFGSPLMVDDKGKKTAAGFCIVSLGKLGSRELNYSSDIDLLFLYSAEGETSGHGTRGVVTNREYFVKLGETVTQVVGKQVGEGAAYRVDMRLRPHGRVGPLAISVSDAVRYYTSEAHDWERQVLIRSRASAGDPEVYKSFFEQVESSVFMSGFAPVEGEDLRSKLNPAAGDSLEISTALDNVRRSKQRIDLEQKSDGVFNVKLGRGGIREIEFIAQALQLAYGGSDRWLRAPHTLISLTRLADRRLITEAELTELFNAYEFLRRLEHLLQMENGLQTHAIPVEPDRRALLARRMRCGDVASFDAELDKHTANVHRVFARVFDQNSSVERGEIDNIAPQSRKSASDDALESVPPASGGGRAPVSRSTSENPGFRSPTHGGGTDSQSAAAATDRSGLFPRSRDEYFEDLESVVNEASDFRHRIGAFRRRWSELIREIRNEELNNGLDIREAKTAQTALAEASIDIAIDITRVELGSRYSKEIDVLSLAVMGLGKLGGGAIDYESDLDLVLVYDDGQQAMPVNVTRAEFFSRAAEIFVTALSAMTLHGSIYRVDLRLRPYGKNGTSTISRTAFTTYMSETADMWEWLAYVKIRGVAGDIDLARTLEKDLRTIIHQRASTVAPSELAAETRRMRSLLEKQKARGRRSNDVDIKYGPGGLLDVYFAMRFLQLRDGIPDDSNDRSTEHMLAVLRDRGSLADREYETAVKGYRFLSALDHYLRLTVGRTTRLPLANVPALDRVASLMDLTSSAELLERLTLHRLDIRGAFDRILGTEV